MVININKEFDKIICDLTGEKKTLDKSEKIVYNNQKEKSYKVNVACSTMDEFVDLYYKDTVTMPITCKCGTKFDVYIEPDDFAYTLKNDNILLNETINRDRFYCVKCGIPISITGGIIKIMRIKELGNI